MSKANSEAEDQEVKIFWWIRKVLTPRVKKKFAVELMDVGFGEDGNCLVILKIKRGNLYQLSNLKRSATPVFIEFKEGTLP